MWDQPRFQLTVHKTRGVTAKGKLGFNDLYAVAIFGNEKHKTSVVEKCVDGCWEQNCLLKLKGNEGGSLLVKVCHRNFLLSSDELIGQAEVSLKHFTFYEKPKTSWFKLETKASKKEGEIRLTLTYHAVMPTKLDKPSMTPSKGFANKLKLGRNLKKQRRRKESLCELTNKDCESDRELSTLQIMPGDVKCLYLDSGEERDMEEDVKSSTKKKPANMVNLAITRRHSVSLLNANGVFDHLNAFKDRQNKKMGSSKCYTPNISYASDTSNFETESTPVKQTIIPYKKSNESISSSNESIDAIHAIQRRRTSSIRITLTKPESSNISINDASDSASDNYDDDNNYANIHKNDEFKDLNDKRSIKDENLDFIKEIGGRMVKSVEEMNSRNLLGSHFNQFSKQELIQLILDQREWIKARELYILEIEAYEKRLLLKVLDQSSQGGPMKKSVRNSFMEEINLGVNHVLQKQRLNHETCKIKTEGKSFAKKWFGALFRTK